MSVTLQYNPAPQPANGSTATFFTTFSFLEASDLLVYVDGVLKSLDVDYEVSGEGIAAGGSVTFFIEPLAGSTVLINRKTLASQPEDFVFNDALPTQVVERALDRCIMVVQEITASEGAYLRYPLGEENPQTLLPGTGDRAYKVLGFDGSGVLKMYLPSEIVGLGTVSPTIEDLTVYDNFVSSGLATVKDLRLQDTGFILRKNPSNTRIEHIYQDGTYMRYDPPSKGWDWFVDNNVVATLQGGQLRNVGGIFLKNPTTGHSTFGMGWTGGNSPLVQFDGNDFFYFGTADNLLQLSLVDGTKFKWEADGTFSTFTGNGAPGGEVVTALVTATLGNVTTLNSTTVNATNINPTNLGSCTVPTLTATNQLVAPNTCKAFVSWTWNEVPNPDQLIIRASFNVSGVVRNGDGDWTITFTTPITGGYSVVGVGNGVPNAFPPTADTHSMLAVKSGAYTVYALTTSVRVQSSDNHNNAFNSVHIF